MSDMCTHNFVEILNPKGLTNLCRRTPSRTRLKREIALDQFQSDDIFGTRGDRHQTVRCRGKLGQLN
jgi:hypothetical protein